MNSLGLAFKKLLEYSKSMDITPKSTSLLLGFSLVQCATATPPNNCPPLLSEIKKRRKFFVAGNWKMYGSKKEIDAAVKKLKKAKLDNATEIVVAPPSVYLQYTKNLLPKNIALAVQNPYKLDTGAVSGEVSPGMAKEMGAQWVILGGAERRIIFAETDDEIGQKVCRALFDDMSVILCIGDTFDAKESGRSQEVMVKQLTAAAPHISDWSRVVIAYEPVWATFSGQRPDLREIQVALGKVRTALKIIGKEPEEIRIVYAGCLTKEMASELARLDDLDGFLINGKMALREDFIDVVNSVKNYNEDVKKKVKEAEKKKKN